MFLSKKYLVSSFTLLMITISTYALRDPTRPPDYSHISGEKISSDELTLNGIIYSRNRAFAIINGQRLKIGDMISGSKLIKIEKTTVDIERNGKIKTLMLIQHHQSTK